MGVTPLSATLLTKTKYNNGYIKKKKGSPFKI
jgi:hypothetical protein